MILWKNVLNNLKNGKPMLKRVLKAAPLEILKIVGVFIFIGIASVKGPTLHSKFLRDKVGSKVVRVQSIYMRSGGTGFYVKAPSGKTFILTNKHVCQLKDEANEIKVVQNGESKIRKVIAESRDHDICLVEAGDKRIVGIKIASKGPDLGDKVAIVGHPLLTPMQVAVGDYNGENFFNLGFARGLFLPTRLKVGWTSAPVYPGNSGSPVVNFWGDVVGILFAGMKAHVNMMVPLSSIKEFLNDY